MDKTKLPIWSWLTGSKPEESPNPTATALPKPTQKPIQLDPDKVDAFKRGFKRGRD